MISQFFKEDNGNFSSIRLINLLVIFTTCFVWIFSVVTKGDWQPSVELCGLIVTLVGMKIYQKKFEE